MPFAPELLSAPALARLEEKRQQELVAVTFFDGSIAGEPDALVKSLTAVPAVHDGAVGRSPHHEPRCGTRSGAASSATEGGHDG
jgi:hypothetical protein